MEDLCVNECMNTQRRRGILNAEWNIPSYGEYMATMIFHDVFFHEILCFYTGLIFVFNVYFVYVLTRYF